MKKIFGIFIVTITLSMSLIAQTIVRQVISPIGLSSNSTGNYISHTVGQPTPPTSTLSSNIAVRQGFEQPPKVKIIPKVKENLTISIYPNPNDGHFWLNVETNIQGENYSFEIFNMIGKLIYTGSGIGQVEKEIKLPFFTGRSTYMIKIKTDNGDTGDGKIIVIG
jgi:hypothetical protein